MKVTVINVDMKNILNLLVLFIVFSCKAQTIIPIAGGNNPLKYKSGTYNKDVDNDLDKFVGIWKFQQGNTSLEIIFKKIVHSYYSIGGYYEDLLIGEYRYVANGTEIVNTLERINQQLGENEINNIEGNLIINRGYFPQCSECSINEKRVKLHIADPIRDYLDNAIVLRYSNENGTARIKAKIYKNGASISIPSGAVDEMRVPYGEYVLTKQP